MRTSFFEYFWGNKARLSFLLVGSAIMLLTILGMRELWTQEWRWADISWHMIYSGDYLHPYLAGEPYYDKPLLSYWLMIAVSFIVGGLSEFTLRLPSALAGILSIYCTYRLGELLVNKKVGFMAGWMLTTSYYFIFWARTANADMLNLAGTLLAILWYFQRRDRPNLINFTIFFLILSITSLFKGLIGIIIPLIAILPDFIKANRWKKYLRISLLPALLPALIIYFLPFWASTHFGGEHYSESGLYQVYRENFLRYFEPFDHKDPIYTYLIFLPIYMLPWAFFFIPALFAIRKRWSTMNEGSRWFVYSTLLIFIFFTCSGSRRNYYTLPLVPFATLLTADWIMIGVNTLRRCWWANRVLIISFILLWLNFGVFQPLYYWGGLRTFAKTVQQQASTIQPWDKWNVVLLDARNKISFYLNPATPSQLLELSDKNRDRSNYSAEELIKEWPILLLNKPDTLLVTRAEYLEKIKSYLKDYQIIIAEPSLGDKLLKIQDPDQPVALIPRKNL